jgi:type IV secretion system protein TrbI
MQTSQGGDTASSGDLNAQQSIAAGHGQLGQELARRNARIQPTLLVAGYRCTVSMTKDMILRPWIPTKTQRTE